MLIATWHATYDDLLGAEKVAEITARWHSVEKLARELAEAEARPHLNALLIAERGGEIMGTTSVHRQSADVAELARLYVAPGQQGQGIGEALLRAGMARFPEAGKVRLEVEPRNIRAIGFYARHGFQPVSNGSACGGDAAAAIAHLIMEAPLPLLRPAEDRDAQDLFGLIALCFAEYPGSFVDPHDDLPDLVRPGHWKERRGDTGALLGGEYLVLEDAGGRICACIALEFPGEAPSGSREAQPGVAKTAELRRLYVRPDCRRMGLAERLVGHVERLARSEGATRMVLWSDSRFTRAHRLYTRLGYTQTGALRECGDISQTTEFHFEKPL